MDSRFIRALLRQPVDRTPVWMMRQAGRYLPEYRALRQLVPDFMTFCRTPELAAQATLQPLARFPLDAAIIFSDILTVPDAMGMPVQFVTGEGPRVANPISSMADVGQLQLPDVEKDLGYVMAAIRQTKQAMAADIPLIGFSGSPWTLATYMVEGEGSKLWLRPRTMVYQQPKVMLALLQKLTAVVIDYVNAQIAAGADAIMIFDSWGGVLSYQAYQDFSLHFMRQIASGIKRERDGQRIPLIFYTKQAAPWLSLLADSGCDAIGVDWTIDMATARSLVNDRVALQGNLDPAVLFAGPDVIANEVYTILHAMDGSAGHVLNLGHGVDKDTPIDAVHAMMKALHDYHRVEVV